MVVKPTECETDGGNVEFESKGINMYARCHATNPRLPQDESTLEQARVKLV